MTTDTLDTLKIEIESNRAAQNLFGPGGVNLKVLEGETLTGIRQDGNILLIGGAPEDIAYAQKVINKLLPIAKKKPIDEGDIKAAARFDETASKTKVITLVTEKKTVKPRTETQAVYIAAIASNDVVFGTGPAGTGKTYLAVAFAAAAMKKGLVERIIITRPAVEAGEKLGFLPGDMKEKVDPYMQPIYDALYETMGADAVERGLVSGTIEIAPLAFMRGRTLKNAVVLLDEAQNTTATQMKMFLTRLGEGSKMIINGDESQIDLPKGTISGLKDAFKKLAGVEGIGHVAFTDADVVRHDLVRRIVQAYERHEHAPALPHP